MDTLLTSYSDWTEYSLYLLAAERASLLARHHLWADDPSAPAHLHAHPALSIWGGSGASRADVERLFGTDDPGLFAVVQSNSGLPAAEVAAAAADHFPVRFTDATSPATVEAHSQLQERARVASRLAAQGIYRARRKVRRARLRAG